MSIGLRDHLLEHYTLTPLTHLCQRLMASPALHALSGGSSGSGSSGSGSGNSTARYSSPRNSLFVPTPPPPPLTTASSSSSEAVGVGVGVGVVRPSSRDSIKEETQSNSEDSSVLNSRPTSAATPAQPQPQPQSQSQPQPQQPLAVVLRSRLLSALEFATNIVFNLTPHRPLSSSSSSHHHSTTTTTTISAQTMSPSLFALFDTCELLVRRYCPASVSIITTAQSSNSSGSGSSSDSKHRSTFAAPTSPHTTTTTHSASLTPRSAASSPQPPLTTTASAVSSSSRVVSLPSISLSRHNPAPPPPPTAALQQPLLSPPASPSPAALVSDALAELELECVHYRLMYAAAELPAVYELRMSWYSVLQPLVALRTTSTASAVSSSSAAPYAVRLSHSPVLMARVLHDCYVALGQCRPCPHTHSSDEVVPEAVGAWTDGIDGWALFAPAIDLLLALCEAAFADAAHAHAPPPKPHQLLHSSRRGGGGGGVRSSASALSGSKTSRTATAAAVAPTSHSLQLGECTGRVRAVLSALITWKPAAATDVLLARAQQIARLA